MTSQEYIQRPLLLQRLITEKDRDMAKVITGIRRSGKSFLLFTIFRDYLIKQGIPEDRIIAIDLETQKNAQYRDAQKLYSYITNLIYDRSKKTYVFLDEIQMVPNFEDLVNGLRIDDNCDVYITGSNAQLLSKDINTRFRGRSVEIRTFPLSFQEYFSYRQEQNVTGAPAGRNAFLDTRKIFNDYLVEGGMPYSVTLPSMPEKHAYLNDICNLVLFRDIIDRYKVRNENLLKAVFDLLCSQIGSYVSANKVANTLKSNGYSHVSAETIGNYLEYFCDSFLLYKAQRYDIRRKAYLKTLNKYYVTDLGIRNSRLNFRQLEITHSLENLVYIELVRRGYIVDIGKNRDKEIDFLVSNGQTDFYIQVSYTVIDEKTRDRELSAFNLLDDGYKKILITMDDNPYTALDRGYKQINALDFFLDNQALEKI